MNTGIVASVSATEKVSPRPLLYVAVFLLALTVRLLFVFLKDTVGLSEPPNPDPVAYQGIARSILSGTAYGSGSGSSSGCVSGTFFAPPLYPFFLAAIYKLFGLSNQLALVAQTVLGALAAVFIAAMAGRLFGLGAFWVAGLVAATHPSLTMQTGELMTEPLFVFLYVGSLLLCVVALTRSIEGRRLGYWGGGTLAMAGAGLVLGAAMLCRPTPFVGLPVLILALVLVRRQHPIGVRLFQAGVFTLATILVIAPWILRIYSRCHVWVPIATSGEFTLYTCNAPGWADHIFLGTDLKPGQLSDVQYYPLLHQYPPGWFARNARAEIFRDPRRFARLSLVRAKLFFKVFPERRGPPFRFLLALWNYTILFPLGLAGLAYSLVRRQPFAWVMLPFLAMMCMLHIVSSANMRYRISLVDAVLPVFLAGLVAGPVWGLVRRLGRA